MDHLASICVAFPPDHAAAADPDDVAYHKALEDQLTKLAKLLKEPSQPLRTNGLELLQLLDPSLHSLSYLAILHALLIPFSGLGASAPVQEKLLTFMLTFDARQLRYAGPHLLDLLNGIGRDCWIPVSSRSELCADSADLNELRSRPWESNFSPRPSCE
jgi:COP9 signalosome complex subunit 3